MPPSSSQLRIVLCVFLPFAGGYFLSYLFRSVNAIIAPDLTADLSLSPADLGLLTAAYFLTFAAVQLPLGIALDRYGPRRVQTCLLLVGAIGAAMFGYGTDLGSLVLARGLIGVGVAGGLMTSFKAIVMWFPAKRWPLVNGCFMATGGLGALAATQPVELALRVTDWRGVFFWLAGITVAAAIVILFVVPEKPASHGNSIRLREQMRSLGHIFRDPLFWCLAPSTVAFLSCTMSIQGLWVGPWLADVAGLARPDIAHQLFVLSACLTLGFVLTGVLADLLARRGIGTFRSMVLGMIILMTAQALLVLQIQPTAYWVLALFGVSANVVALSYSMLSRHFPVEYAGRANTALNLIVFAGAFIAQYALGAIIGWWERTPHGGRPAVAYAVAFGVVFALQAATFAWLILRGRKLKLDQL